MTEGFVVVETDNGTSGLTLARETKPDVVICDLTLPQLDGYAVLRGLRADRQMASSAFLLIGAPTGPEEVRAAMNLGADDFLYKPLCLPDLLLAVQTRLARRNEQGAARALTLPGQFGLSPREGEVLFWVAQGKTNPEIAVILEIGRATVKTHLQKILEKTGTHNRLGAATLAFGETGIKQIALKR